MTAAVRALNDRDPGRLAAVAESTAAVMDGRALDLGHVKGRADADDLRVLAASGSCSRVPGAAGLIAPRAVGPNLPDVLL